MDKCKHGFDHACLICGFTHIDGKKVWFDWAWQEQQNRNKILQSEYERLQNKLKNVLEALDGESSNSWGLWKEKADMLEQGASNAYEKAYWMVKEVLGGETNNES